MGGKDELVLARMGAGRDPDRAAGGHAVEDGEGVGVGRRGRHVEFEIAGDADPRRAELRQPLGIGLRLRQAGLEAGQKEARRLGPLVPAREGALRHPAVDHHHRHAAALRLDQQVGPDLGFADQAELGAPVVEEAAHVARHVERQVLMDGPGRQARRQKPCRGDRAGGHQHREPPLLQPGDQRQQGHGLAHAGAVQPDELAVRALDAGVAAPLGQPLRIFLAAAAAPLQQPGRKRLQQGGAQPVASDEGALAAHAGAPAAGRPACCSRRPAPGSRLPTSS